MLDYQFMRVAFVVGIALAIALAMLGQVLVLRRLSLIGDALSHGSLAGVAAGLVLGMNPTVAAVGVTVIFAFGIEFFRRMFPRYGEIATSVIMSFGIGLAGILQSRVSGQASLMSFLFGSLVAIPQAERYMVLIICAIVVVLALLLGEHFMSMTFDTANARIQGIQVNLLQGLLTLMTALTIAAGARTAGTLVVSSLMVIPFASVLRLRKSYRATMLLSVIVGVINMVLGLTISYYAGTAPGGTIVLTSVGGLVLISLGAKIHDEYSKKRGLMSSGARTERP